MAWHHLLHPVASSKHSAGEAPWLAVGRAPSSGYEAPNLKRFHRMQSRRQGVSVLLTFGSKNSSRKAGGSDVLQATVGNGEGSLWCGSGYGDGSGGSYDDRWSSSKHQQGMGSLGPMGRMCKLRRQWRLGLGASNPSSGAGFI
jgi:hypothetical protein